MLRLPSKHAVIQADTGRAAGADGLPGTGVSDGSQHGAPYDSDIALLADLARAAMLMGLLDGLPRAAGELGKLAGVTPATASSHLARLLDGGMRTVHRQGRHRYYRLASPEIATVIEFLARVSPDRPGACVSRGKRQRWPRQDVLRPSGRPGRGGSARCPAGDRHADHPGPGRCGGGGGAGRSAAARPLAEAATGYTGTEAGAAALASFGVDVSGLLRSRRKFAGPCLDWTQRRPHLNGALGAAITSRLLQLGWIERGRSRRPVRVTPAGQDGLARTFGWSAGD